MLRDAPLRKGLGDFLNLFLDLRKRRRGACRCIATGKRATLSMYCCRISTYLVAGLISFHRRYLHALRWGVLRHGGDVFRDLWHKDSQNLFHDSFQSCETRQN